MSKKHKGFYMDVDGDPVHFLADPNMTPETKAALEALVRAAKKHMDDKPLTDWDNIRVCVVCHDRECVAPATKCGSCLMQEMIDEVG